MASYNELNALIDAYINRNGVQAITGQILNGVLKAMVEQLGRGYTIMGAALPTDDPGTPDGPECYFASETGTYTDFDGLQIVPGELALLCYTPSDGWTKETIYEGFQTVQATIDGNVGTPSVGVSYANGVLSFDFHNMKGNPGQNGQDGQDGDPAGFGTIGADITGGVGTPGVTVESSGPATAKNLQFHFTNLKGETGVTSVVATVDNTTGTPACTVSLVGQQLTLAFSGLKGAQGNTGSSVDYPFTIVNNLTTDDATQALSAAQGVVLAGQVSQLEHEVNENFGIFSAFPELNSLIREMYCSMAAISNTDTVIVQYDSIADAISISFYNGSTNIGTVLLRHSLITGDVYIVKESYYNGIFIFFLDLTKWGEVTSAFAVSITRPCVISGGTPNVDGKPNITNELFLGNNFRYVDFQYNAGYRIDTNGNIVSSTSNWFYSVPIPVKKNEVVHYYQNGNGSVAVVSYTDSQGTTYEPCVAYKNVDPARYDFTSDRDGYISVCGQVSLKTMYLVIGGSPVISGLSAPKVIDRLDSASATDALSAKQGAVLKGMLDAITPSVHGYNYNDVSLSNAKSNPDTIKKASLNPAAWTATGGSIGSLVTVYDEVNEDYKECLELVDTDNGRFMCAFDSAIDVSDKAFRIAIKLGNIAEQYRGTFQVRLWSGGHIDDAHLCRIRLQAPYNSGLPDRTRCGWWFAAVNALYSGQNGENFDATNVTHCGVMFYNNQQEVSIYVHELSFAPAKNTGGAVIVIDNYNDKVPLMADYAFSKGVKLNLSIIPNKIGETFGPDTQATLEEINRGKAQGHLIFNHTFNHNTAIETETVSMFEVNNAERWMLNNGFVRGARIVSVPSSLFPDTKYKAYMKTNALCIYHGWLVGPNPIESAPDGYLVHYPYYPATKMLCISALDSNISQSTPQGNMAYLIDAVEAAVAAKGFVVLGFHGTFWQRDNGVLWKQFIDEVAAVEGVHFYGIDEVVENLIV